MKIFLSYASQDRPTAALIHRALREQDHDVFFDREDLPAGEEFHARIRRAIEDAHLLIFLISPHALDAGSYTLTELAIAERVFRQVSGRFLPVMVQPVDYPALPALVTAVTILETQGDIPAAVADAVHRIARRRRRRLWWWILAGGLAAIGLAAGIWSVPAGDDGAPAVLVPAGSAILGDDEILPRREIYLDAYYMDQYEVTTGRYALFLEATPGMPAPDGWQALNLDRDGALPVVGVNWHEASAYCAWAGRRLPTEAEWEKAARGTDQRRYPWGDASPTLDHANFSNTSPEAYAGGLAAVGSHPLGRSPYGVHDMAGNVSEWVADWFAESIPRAAVRNPQGPASGATRVVRGGARFEPAERQIVTQRWFGNPDLRSDAIGFRCARNAR